MHANLHHPVGQASPDTDSIAGRQAEPDLQTPQQPFPRTRAILARVHLERLGMGDRSRVTHGGSACHAEPLDEVGLHRVRMIRLEGYYAQEFYLDDHAQIEAFVAAAIAKLCRKGEDPGVLRREFRQLIHARLAQYEQTTNHVVVEPLSKVMPAEVQWLWPGYIAADKLAVLVGEPGVGKTLTALDIAARVTTGAPWPTDPPGTERREPGSVILLSEMDDSADTLCPRLEAVGADVSRVHLVRTYIEAGDSGAALPFSVGGSLDMLSACVDRVSDCRLIIIDPLTLYVEGTLNRREVTELLGYLIELAVEKEVAILVVSHFGRSQFHYGSQVTAKFVAAARTVWRIVDDDHEYGRRVLLPLKNNLGTDRHGLAFRIDEEVEALFPAPKVVWEQKQFEIGMQRATFAIEKGEEQRALGSRCRQRLLACEWLRSQLIAGGMLAQHIKQAAKQEQIGIKLLRSALDHIGGISHRGPTGHYMWFLPESLSLAQRQALNLAECNNEKCAATQDFQELQDFQGTQAQYVGPNVDAAA